LPAAEHHIFGLQPNGGMFRYSVGGKAAAANHAPNPLTIWALKRQVPALDSFLGIWGKGRNTKSMQTAAGWLRGVFSRIAAGTLPPKAELQRAALLILTLAPASYMAKLQQHAAIFGATLTPQYRQLLPMIDLSLPPRSELIFHACHPDIYLWIPPGIERPKKLIVCFGTRKNTLNAPRPLVHFELAKTGVALIYVGHRPDHDPAKGLIGRDLQGSADLILTIAKEFGLTKLYGLGTSLGGYAALHYAPLLNFERVINYSGAPLNLQSEEAKQNTAWMHAEHYAHEKILTVLSKTDATDQKILAYYQKHGFETKWDWVSTQSHGSLTSSIVEGKFQRQISQFLFSINVS
jgi:predicted esterase YcpF (UPF0227 family)